MTDRVEIQIWPVHKLVCGSRGNPWKWPGFSQEEAEEVLSLRHKRVLDTTHGVMSLLEMYKASIEQRPGEDDDTFEELYHVSFVYSVPRA